jgi:ribosomal protein S12 methylthiotransferase accessory factor
MQREPDVIGTEELRNSSQLSPSRALRIGESVVDSRLGPISRLRGEGINLGRDYRYIYAATVQDTEFFEAGHGRFEKPVGGVGANETEARIRAIGEGLERYALSMYDSETMERSSYSEGSIQVDPTGFNKLSTSQLAERGLSERDLLDAELHWVPARNLTSDEVALVPGQVVFCPFHGNPAFHRPTTSGAAAGTDYTTASFRAIAECFERDGFLIHYLNEIRSRPVPERAVPASSRKLYEYVRSNFGEIRLRNLSLSGPFRICAALSVDPDAVPTATVGLGCSLDLSSATVEALEELLQIRYPGGRTAREHDGHEVRTVEQRASFWDDRDNLDELDFWLETETTAGNRRTDTCHSGDGSGARSGLEVVREYLKRRELECYITDITPRDIERTGFKVVVANVPKLHPMYLDERFRYLGGERLYREPVRCGLRETERTADELNTTPHPLL